MINKRAGGTGLISGRKAFQRPMAEGVELLNAIQDVYLDDVGHDRLTRAGGPESRDHRPTAGRRRWCCERRRGIRCVRLGSLRGGNVTDTAERRAKTPEPLHRVVVRFAGDSGDGMQLTGDRFTSVSAAFGNDLSTLPEFPAEIRAPAGTVNGVSSFQVHISDHDITTPGDAPNVLVAMNPAALRADLTAPEPGGHADRQRRHLRRAQPDQGRLRREPARRRLAQRLQGRRRADDAAHQGGHASRSA